jgi:ABC-type transport system involved in cytochrome c biogenesis permease subunit
VPAAIAGGLGVLYMLFAMLPPTDPPDQMHLEQAAKLPVVEGGRVKPLDAVARNYLMVISNRQTFVDEKGKRQPAIKWLFDVMATRKDKGPAFDYKVFRIVNTQLLAVLNLQPRDGFRYSLGEILPRYDKFAEQYKQVANVAAGDRDAYQNSVYELAGHLHLYQELSDLQEPRVVPPLAPGEKWQSLVDAISDMHNGKGGNAGAQDVVMLLKAYMQNDAKEFNAELASYQTVLDKSLPGEVKKASFEYFFHNFAPFYQCSILYVFVLVLVCAGWLAFPNQLHFAAFALAVVALAVQTFAFIGRMYLMDRPFVFVTNLYSTTVFVGWISVIVGLVLEWIYGKGLGCFVAAAVASLTMLIGHHLATTGDTLEMMQAVLDTNFWLATHVTTINIGYAATLVPAGLGMVLIGLGVFTTMLDKSLYRVLGQMMYGTICFAMLFSFVGTVLGGIWADQSWGRFWGWDPKENGALLIVLMNAIILHARWCGLIQQRGMAILAVLGSLVTAWSWWGVNMLGVGLHAYAEAKGSGWLLAFGGLQLSVIGIGLVPTRLWPSFAVAEPTVSSNGPAAAVSPPVPETAITAQPPLANGRRKSKHIKRKN